MQAAPEVIVPNATGYDLLEVVVAPGPDGFERYIHREVIPAWRVTRSGDEFEPVTNEAAPCRTVQIERDGQHILLCSVTCYEHRQTGAARGLHETTMHFASVNEVIEYAEYRLKQAIQLDSTLGPPKPEGEL